MVEIDGSLRILVIDDNQDAADSLTRVLKLWGHDAWQAYDGATGLAMALVYRPSVILLDITLPDMNGLQLVDALRHRRGLEDVAVISISGHNDFDVVTELFAAGVNDHFPKPINLIALREVLDKRPRPTADPTLAVVV